MQISNKNHTFYLTNVILKSEGGSNPLDSSFISSLILELEKQNSSAIWQINFLKKVRQS